MSKKGRTNKSSLKNSEPIVRNYLTDWLIGLENEREVGSKKPDFSIWDAAGECIGYWEVKDAAAGQLEDLDCANGFRSGKPRTTVWMEKAIRDKSEQFKGSGAVPGMLVLASPRLKADDVVVALMGWPVSKWEIHGNGPIVLDRDMQGKAYHHRNAEDNNYISAVGLLRMASYARRILEDYQTRAFKAYGNSNSAWAMVDSLGKQVVDHGERPYLDIFLNPFAHYPWPEDLVGPNDRVFNLAPDSLRPQLLADKLLERERIPLPSVSSTQADLDALLRDPNLRA